MRVRVRECICIYQRVCSHACMCECKCACAFVWTCVSASRSFGHGFAGSRWALGSTEAIGECRTSLYQLGFEIVVRAEKNDDSRIKYHESERHSGVESSIRHIHRGRHPYSFEEHPHREHPHSSSIASNQPIPSMDLVVIVTPISLGRPLVLKCTQNTHPWQTPRSFVQFPEQRPEGWDVLSFLIQMVICFDVRVNFDQGKQHYCDRTKHQDADCHSNVP